VRTFDKETDMTETFPCGCTITFGKLGEVRAVNVCDGCGIFSEDKSLRQLTIDIHHKQLQIKHAPKINLTAEESAK
jgi:hypothetical protein